MARYVACGWCGRKYDPFDSDHRGYCSERCYQEHLQLVEKKEQEAREAENAYRRQKEEDAKRREEARKQDPRQWRGDEWASHLKAHPEDAAKLEDADWRKLSAGDLIGVLESHPNLVSDCRSSSSNWVELLVVHPEFAEPLKDRKFWGKIDEMHWAKLLAANPQFLNRCEGLSSFGGEFWSVYLSKRPGEAEKCVVWERFEGKHWIRLLRSQPQFAEKCNAWEHFNGKDWSSLLSAQPRFADKCDWDSLNVQDWDLLLKAQHSPEFLAKKREINKAITDAYCFASSLTRKDEIDEKIWNDPYPCKSILHERPAMIRRMPTTTLAKIETSDWKWIMRDQPTIVKYQEFWANCKEEEVVDALIKVLEKHPQFIKWIPKAVVSRKEFQKNRTFIRAVLIDDPRLVTSDEIEVLSRSDWAEVVRARPELLGVFLKTKVYEKKPEDAWSGIIANVPDLYDKCPCVDRFTSSDWGYILVYQPQLADKCNCWDRFDRVDWRCLLESHPQFADRCHCWKKFDKNDWKSLIEKQPIFKKQYRKYHVGCLGCLFRIVLLLAGVGVLISIAASYFEKHIDKLPQESQMDAQAAAGLGHKIRNEIGLR